MTALFRAGRSCKQEQARRERQRKLVLEALAEKQMVQTEDRLLLDLITAIPRSTPQRIEEILAKMKKDDAQAAEQFEEALVHCNNLAENLNGIKPDMLGNEGVNVVWSECIQAVSNQTARMKITPVVVIHPYVGTVAVLNSVCGKHQANSEYARMRMFGAELRDGINDIVTAICPVKDNHTGLSLTQEEVKEALLDISGQGGDPKDENEEAAGRLSEDDSDFNDYNDELRRVNNDWCNDVIDTKPKPVPRKVPVDQISPVAPRSPTPMPTFAPAPEMLTITPPRSKSINSTSNSTLSSFSSPLDGVETASFSPLNSTQKSTSKSDKTVCRSLFTERIPERRASLAPKPSTPVLQTEPDRRVVTVAKAKPASDFFDKYPDGYKVVPLKKSPQKSDAKKGRDNKKRAINSPNLPSSKSSRMEQTEMAIRDLQINQSSNNVLLQNLTATIDALALNLGLQMQKKN